MNNRRWPLYKNALSNLLGGAYLWHYVPTMCYEWFYSYHRALAVRDSQPVLRTPLPEGPFRSPMPRVRPKARRPKRQRLEMLAVTREECEKADLTATPWQRSIVRFVLQRRCYPLVSRDFSSARPRPLRQTSNGCWKRALSLSSRVTEVCFLVYSNYRRKLSCLQLACKSYFANCLTQLTLKNSISSIRHLSLAEGLEERGCMLPFRTRECARDVHTMYLSLMRGRSARGTCRTASAATVFDIMANTFQIKVLHQQFVVV